MAKRKQKSDTITTTTTAMPSITELHVAPLDRYQALAVIEDLGPCSIQTMIAELKRQFKLTDETFEQAVQHSFVPYLIAPLLEKAWLRRTYLAAAAEYQFEITAAGKAELKKYFGV